jgi:mannose-6-phosphate isomerase-like protein (cupin superfamily)
MTEEASATPGEAVFVFTDRIRFLATAEQTAGGFLAVEVEVPPGGGPPPLHTHEAAELFFTVSGELSYFRQEADGSIAEITGGPGTTAFVQGGVPHTYRNLSAAPGTCIAVLTPPGTMEAFFLAAGTRPGDPPSPGEIVLGIARDHGMTILDVVPERQPAGGA